MIKGASYRSLVLLASLIDILVVTSPTGFFSGVLFCLAKVFNTQAGQGYGGAGTACFIRVYLVQAGVGRTRYRSNTPDEGPRLPFGSPRRTPYAGPTIPLASLLRSEVLLANRKTTGCLIIMG